MDPITLFGRQIAARTVGLIVAALVAIAVISFGVSQCSKRRSEAAQGRVERSQAGAASNSGADAIGTVSAAGTRETASEDLTRSNEREIRNADGAGERVKPGVDYAGRKALCQREAYRASERCKIFRKEAR